MSENTDSIDFPQAWLLFDLHAGRAIFHNHFSYQLFISDSPHCSKEIVKKKKKKLKYEKLPSFTIYQELPEGRTLERKGGKGYKELHVSPTASFTE